MPDLLDEVIDEHKQERLFRFFATYGKHLIALTAVGLLLTGIYTWHKHTQLRHQIESGNMFYAAHNFLLQGKTEEATKSLDTLTKEASYGYKELAQLKHAELLTKENKPQEALSIYQAITSDSAANPAIKDLAELYIVRLAMMHPELQVNTIDTMLDKLAADNKPWRFIALELQALQAIEKNDHAKAKALFTQLSEAKITSPTQRQRAQKMLDIITQAMTP